MVKINQQDLHFYPNFAIHFQALGSVFSPENKLKTFLSGAEEIIQWVKLLTLHAANLCSIPQCPYDPQALPRVIPVYRVRRKSWKRPGMIPEIKAKKNK